MAIFIINVMSYPFYSRPSLVFLFLPNVKRSATNPIEICCVFLLPKTEVAVLFSSWCLISSIFSKDNLAGATKTGLASPCTGTSWTVASAVDTSFYIQEGLLAAKTK